MNGIHEVTGSIPVWSTSLRSLVLAEAVRWSRRVAARTRTSRSADVRLRLASLGPEVVIACLDALVSRAVVQDP